AEALAQEGVLFRQFERRGLPLVDIIDTTLRMSKRGLLDIFRQAALEPEGNLLIVIDQFEELFRFRKLSSDLQSDSYEFSEESTAFVKLLLELQEEEDCPIYVVLTMRSDFLGDCTQFVGLAEAINMGLYLVPRLSPEERQDAIRNPIRVQGAEIETVLITRLVNDVGENPDQLSILQHALNRTWANWQEEGMREAPLSLRHYEAIGTMSKALDAHAEEAYSELHVEGVEPSRRQHLCRQVFQALTDKATDGRGIRRPTTLGLLCSLVEASEKELTEIIDVFRQRSFLMPPADESLTEEKVIDISHESLMRVWERLKGWVQDEAQAAQTYRRLAESAALHSMGEASTLRDPELTIFRNWQRAWRPNHAWAERYAPGFDRSMKFLANSIAERDAELAEQERREEEEAKRKLDEANRARLAAEERQRLLRRGLIGMGAFAFLSVAASIFAGWQLVRAKNASAKAFAATARLQLGGDPFGAMVNALAAIGPLANEPAESFELSQILASAVSANWQIGSISSGQNTVYTLMEAANGELISGGRDGTLRRWRDGQPIGEPIQTGQERVWRVLHLKNGDWVSAGYNGTLRFWRDGKPLGKAIQTGQENILDMLLLSNGELITSGYNKTLRRWRDDGKPLGGPIPSGQGMVWTMMELKNGDVITGGGDGSLRRWRAGVPIGEPIYVGSAPVNALIEMRNGEWVTGSSDGIMQRWRDGVPIGRPIQTTQGDIDSLIQLKSGELISGGADGSLRRWRDGKPISGKIPTGQGRVKSLLQMSSGELVSGGHNGIIRRWRSGDTIAGPIQTRQGAVQLIQRSNGDLVSGGEDGTLQLWRHGKSITRPIPTGHGGVGVMLERRNGELITTGSDGIIQRWRLGKKVGGAIQTRQKFVYSLEELPNGDVVTGGGDGTIRRWRDGKPVGTPIQTDHKEVWVLEMLRSGELVSSGKDGKIRWWRNSQPLGSPISAHQGGILSLKALANGEILSGGGDGTLRRWVHGRPIGERILTGQSGIVSILELNSGELVTGATDGSFRRWLDGKPLGEASQTGQGSITSLVEGKNNELLIAGTDGRIRRWLLGTSVVTAACRELLQHPALTKPQTPLEEEASSTCRRQGQLK
ncbi:MAG: hypothetical protein VKM17_01360, partial [Cyanobacteriota bacterium]|nr:hypothetical protein [Cyanobacteriota bacterium]